MSKPERVSAALRGDDVDCVPVSAWWHDFAREWSPEGLAQATLEAYRRYDWDFIKVNPRACYYGEAWGARYQQSDDPHQQPKLIEPGVSSPQDLRGVRPLDVTQGAYAEQLAALSLIADDLAGEAPFVQTVFSPLAAMSRITGSTKYVQKLMREAPEDLLAALDAVAETLCSYAAASLQRGASGIFFATVEWGGGDNISPQDYDRFARPFDLRVLKAVQDAPFNVLHVCRDNNHLLRLLDYPVSALHWDVHGPGNPSLDEVLGRRGAAMGGVSARTMASGTPHEVRSEARNAIGETGWCCFLLAPGCSIDPQVPQENLRALAEVARP